jgi:hypothetical protein
MKYAVKMGSGAMMYVLSIINNGLSIQKLLGQGSSQTAWTQHNPILIFSK